MPAPGTYVNDQGIPLLPLIEAAQHSLDIEIYTMEDPFFRQAIREALERNVFIRIVKEPNPDQEVCDVFGTKDQTPDCQDQRKLVTDVNSAGGIYTTFNKKTLCPNGGNADGSGCYEHGKIAIADETTALISTGNFDADNLCISSENPEICNRDYTLIDTDSTVVNTLETIFQADLQGQPYNLQSDIPAELSDVLFVSPLSLQPIVDFIGSARSTLEIETQYLKDPQMNEAIISAAQRGVSVSVTVASICAFGKPSATESSEATTTYTSFDQANISTAMFNKLNLVNGRAGYMHAKVIIADGNRAWLGSENGSAESMTENREYGVVFTDPTWIATIEPVVQADHTSAESETWQQSIACAKDDEKLDIVKKARMPKPVTH